MCLIVYNPEGKFIEREWIKNAHESNPHGFGIMWAEKNKVYSIKGMLDFEQIWSTLKTFKGQSYACHFRFRTHGEMTSQQCHPHRVIKNKLYLMHNGVLNNFPCHSVKSDTMLFAKSLRKKIQNGNLNRSFLFMPEGSRYIENIIGGWNKILFMNNFGEVSIANEKLGTWENEIWYSNLYSLRRRWIKEPASVILNDDIEDDAERLMRWLEKKELENKI